MEYLQVKTPFIEKWEKEILTNPASQAELLSQYVDFTKLQDIDGSSVLPSLEHDKVAAAAVEDIKKAAAAAAASSVVVVPSASAKKRKSAAKELEKEEEEVLVTNPETGETEVRKEQHNAVEKRRRDKINVTITELKELVPNCKHFATNKASILHHASEHIKHLAQTNAELLEANRRLQDSNSHLIAELTELHRLLWGVHASNPNAAVAHALMPHHYSPLAAPMAVAPSHLYGPPLPSSAHVTPLPPQLPPQ